MAFLGGLFGGKSEKYQGGEFSSQAGDYLMNQLRGSNDINVRKAIDDYSAGKISLEDLLASGAFDANGTIQGFNEGAKAKLASDVISGSKLATEQVAENDILGQLYGDDSALSRALAEEQDLAGRGFSLQPEDYEAYGQASDQIARNFAQEEQSLAQMLADRGLSNSGVAMQQFSGLAGNKNERLAQMQRQIANDRMQANLARLQNTRAFLNNLGSQAGQEIQAQFGRNQAGIESQQGALERKQKQDQDFYFNNAQIGAGAEASKRSQGGLLDAITGGIVGGIGGGISSGIGGGISNQIGGLFQPSKPAIKPESIPGSGSKNF